MALHELAGKLAPQDILVNIPRLISKYYTHHPNPDDVSQSVSFGTSGHRGSSLTNTFNETHIIAISQAICEHRSSKKINGPLFLGMDTHALSEPAFASAVEVFTANEVELRIQSGLGYTPTPVISHAILTYNQGRSSGFADGVIITPSHNPPHDGGFKYNPPHGGPADAGTTRIIQDQANKIIRNRLKNIKRCQFERALKADNVVEYDYIIPYIKDLANVIDMEAISNSGLTIGADPMGGSGVEFWGHINEMYALNLEVVNPYVDQTFSFMSVDKDGKIRMDCSSPYAMAQLINLKDKFDIAFGNDTDFDRHGIVTKSCGLMNPNHYLAVAIWYLFQNRPHWRKDAAIGKTLVSSSMIDRVANQVSRKLAEVPVGFKWFVDGLVDGSYGFGGEESAGASFLKKDGTTWTTDKDGFIMDLLAAEIIANTSKDPGEHYHELIEQFGNPIYERLDTAATHAQKKVLKNLSPDMVAATTLAGDSITAKLTHAPGNQAAIGGLKIITPNGWFAARPSGTEDIYKIYAESFKGEDHLKQIQHEAKEIVSNTFKVAGI